VTEWLQGRGFGTSSDVVGDVGVVTAGHAASC